MPVKASPRASLPKDSLVSTMPVPGGSGPRKLTSGSPGAATPDQPQALPTTFRWATVTAVDPLRVRLDGDTAELPFSPDTLVTGLAVDDRVWCHLFGRRIVVLGRGAGAYDSGTLAGGITAAADWTLASQFRRKIGQVASLKIEFTRTGTDYDVPASGNVVNVKVADVPAGFWPTGFSAVLGGGTSGRIAQGYLTGAGEVWLNAVDSGAGDIVVGETLTLGGTFLTV
jgi:hypothetical protein